MTQGKGKGELRRRARSWEHVYDLLITILDLARKHGDERLIAAALEARDLSQGEMKQARLDRDQQPTGEL
jgi:hypothetical protein